MHFLHKHGGCIIILWVDEDKRTFSESNDTGNLIKDLPVLHGNSLNAAATR